jgi:hypothetical protein
MGRGEWGIVDSKYMELNKTLEKYKAVKDVPKAYLQCVSVLDVTIAAVCRRVHIALALTTRRLGATAAN